YLDVPRIPILFTVLGVIYVVLAWAARRLEKLSFAGAGAPQLEAYLFFALGGGFSLLEMFGLSRAALALGSTWVVNSAVISGILSMIIVANLLIEQLARVPAKLIYALLLGAGVVLSLVNFSLLASLPFLAKAVVVGVATGLPMIFAGVLFATAFR